jgi:hypothetical protein
MAGEYLTHDGVLRQTVTHHLQAIPLLTASCAFDVMRVPAVIRVTVVGGGAVHGVEVSKERTQFFNGGDVITRLHPPIIIWLCSLARERVKGGLSAHFLKSRLDIGVDEGDRIVRVLVVHGQIMEHVKQLRACRGTILKATCALHKFGYVVVKYV